MLALLFRFYFVVHSCLLKQIVGKRKPPGLKAYFRQTSNLEPSNSSVAIHLSKYALGLNHPSDGAFLYLSPKNKKRKGRVGIED